MLDQFIRRNFLKRFALLITAVLVLAPMASASPWIKSLAEAQKKSKQTKRLIFVDLFADWCGWCHKMEQEVFPSQTFQTATDNMVLLRLNTEDGGEGTKLSQQFAVTTLPTFLVLTPDNTIAALIRGYAPAGEFVKSMNDAIAKYNDFQKRVAAENTIAGDYQKRLDLAREFTSRFGLKDSESVLLARTSSRLAAIAQRVGTGWRSEIDGNTRTWRVLGVLS